MPASEAQSLSMAGCESHSQAGSAKGGWKRLLQHLTPIWRMGRGGTWNSSWLPNQMIFLILIFGCLCRSSIPSLPRNIAQQCASGDPVRQNRQKLFHLAGRSVHLSGVLLNMSHNCHQRSKSNTWPKPGKKYKVSKLLRVENSPWGWKSSNGGGLDLCTHGHHCGL